MVEKISASGGALTRDCWISRPEYRGSVVELLEQLDCFAESR